MGENITKKEIKRRIAHLAKGIETIHELLELCRVRCRNATNIRKAGACPSENEDGNVDEGLDCFNARFHAADARKLSGELLEYARKLLWEIGDQGGERHGKTG